MASAFFFLKQLSFFLCIFPHPLPLTVGSLPSTFSPLGTYINSQILVAGAWWRGEGWSERANMSKREYEFSTGLPAPLFSVIINVISLILYTYNAR